MQPAKAAGRGAQWCAIALGFSIPLSVALDNLLLAITLVLWIAAGHPRRVPELIRGNPVVASAVVLVALYVLGTTYTIADPDDVWAEMHKTMRYLFLLVLIPLFQDPRVRNRAVLGFMLAIGLTLVLSYLIWVGVIPEATWHRGLRENPAVFKYHITHNLLMAFAAYLFALKARQAADRPWRWFYSLLALAALLNVLIMVRGRTGHAVALLLAVYFFFVWLRWRGAAAAFALIIAIGGYSYFVPGSALSERMTTALRQYQAYQHDRPAVTSVGERLEFYKNSLAIVRDHPVLGVGTGGFPKAYAARVAGTEQEATSNPHNEYLMVAVQLGIVGLAALVWLFATQWRMAARIPGELERHLARGLVIVYVSASAVSSTLIDHTEGVFFVWLTALLFANLNAKQPEKPSRNALPQPALCA